MTATGSVTVRRLTPADFAAVRELTARVYPDSPTWSDAQLASHLEVFPEGQLVAVDPEGVIVGYAASLIVFWDDYDVQTSWRDFTAAGYFTNHDPERGRTLYGSEVMVDPARQRQGIGHMLYEARRALARQLGLLRIRAGARLRGYSRYRGEMSAEEYVRRVVSGALHDPTLSFQLREGFDVLAVVPSYLRHDPESGGWAAVIQWVNPDAPELRQGGAAAPATQP
ncbi:MAG TPA: GNAT family N-acetyltransferase [Gemmatimonadaceae bacterium]|nr:GNAT family N-acetyltransferase [Gemmatimonadaceae bacterium]